MRIAVVGAGGVGGGFGAALAKDDTHAAELDARLAGLHQSLFLEANPIPVKWAMHRMGLCGPTLRLPMTELSEAQHTPVEAALKASGLI